MQKVNIHEAKTRLSAILSEVEKKGETYIICRNGNPVAELVPRKRPNRLGYHPVLSKIKIDYDPVEDLSDDEWGKIE
ncbi:MAG: type II toxin-antitoxin system prevent-host-death family antitoxin [Deltaproteobacteria bacterium]|nr:type II toxin-antitoxin system prevent-host-death family antitoxin [Deltaproteobacteria bacterium]